MAKSSKKQIDQDEKRVIEQLQRNSNESIDKIAKTCGFSRQKVWRIIKRLENNKTIWGYTAIPDKEKQGVRHYIMLLKRSNQPAGDIIDNVLDSFKKYAGKNIGVFVQTACILQGEYDIMLCFTAKDISVAKRFTELIKKRYAAYIGDIMMVEDVFSIRISGMMNPKVDDLKEFFKTP
ncbi:MAG TPA: Lrp/AsnC family transcriptional regulator [Candidatus Thermoplasmatota archaeon]|jgi:DNA-binding Lrp family transcriptional regulator|nr:Lrp/AsnC family transcriptional regulator [Candidatus Thermoplasmatota archaeon]